MRTPVATVKDLRRVVVGEAADEDLRGALAEAKLARPRLREHCEKGPRPCPWKGCRYNLSVDVNGAGSLQEHPEGESDCALDFAAKGGMTLDEVAEVLGVSLQRVQQIEVEALDKLRRAAGKGGVR